MYRYQPSIFSIKSGSVMPALFSELFSSRKEICSNSFTSKTLVKTFDSEVIGILKSEFL